ncbi:MAG TPA: hypothetical protein VFQ22_02440, partial [Longimicrobiales bacterium]|nr:hypothetical protein [Longimicrobiales bacterium]
MLTALTGCDNVAWGGVEWELRAPPAPAPDSAEIAATAPAPPPVLGPVLLAGERDGERATLAVVGELRSDSIVGPPDAAAAPELARQL